jgi:hypothetical protein
MSDQTVREIAELRWVRNPDMRHSAKRGLREIIRTSTDEDTANVARDAVTMLDEIERLQAKLADATAENEKLNRIIAAPLFVNQSTKLESAQRERDEAQAKLADAMAELERLRWRDEDTWPQVTDELKGEIVDAEAKLAAALAVVDAAEDLKSGPDDEPPLVFLRKAEALGKALTAFREKYPNEADRGTV